MICLRETKIEGRDGELKCEFKGCSFKFSPPKDERISSERSEIANIFLNWQMKSGSPKTSNNRPCIKNFADPNRLLSQKGHFSCQFAKS